MEGPARVNAQIDNNWQPATFHERGVAVGFTSPMLAGARVRLLEHRHELVVPHPGGVRGVYIFALGSLAEFCAPTMYDACLARRLQTLHPLTPSAVRLAARAVAAQGAAGRAAAAAALAAAQLDSLRRAGFEASLLVALAASEACAPPAHVPGREVLQTLAGRSGRTVEAIRADVDLLADQMVGAGLDPPAGTLRRQTDRGRCSVLLASLALMAREIRAWVAQCGDQLGGGQFAVAAETAYLAGQVLLEAAQGQADDSRGLMASWAAAPEPVCARLARPDWMLDGWEPLCLSWQLAHSDDEKAEALADIVPRVPPIPREADGWFAGHPDIQARLRARAPTIFVRRLSPQPPSQIVEQIARNERVRAFVQ